MPPPLPPPLPASLHVELGRFEKRDASFRASIMVNGDGQGHLCLSIDDDDENESALILGGESLLDCLREIVANADQVIEDMRNKGQLKRIGWS